MLDAAARSGSLAMLQFLLDPTVGLHPDKTTLDAAAQSYNREMVQFLLEPANGFGLRPDQVTLRQPGLSSNKTVAEFLLDPAQGFNLGSIGIHGKVAWRDAEIKSAIRVYHNAVPSPHKLEELLESARLSLRHFFRLCTYTCLEPELYQLKKSQLTDLVTMMRTVAEEIPPVPVERELTISLLKKTSKEMEQVKQIDIAKALTYLAEFFTSTRGLLQVAHSFVSKSPGRAL